MLSFTLKERKNNAELRELLALETVSLAMKKGRLKWFRHVELGKLGMTPAALNTAQWWKWKEVNQEDVRGRLGRMVSKMIWKDSVCPGRMQSQRKCSRNI